MPRDAYVLYKRPVQLETLSIVQFLNSVGVDMRPSSVVERNHAVGALPSIWHAGTLHEGLDACVAFYETRSGQVDLLRRARAFKEANPAYRINT
jgi:hypothetical protein